MRKGIIEATTERAAAMSLLIPLASLVLEPEAEAEAGASEAVPAPLVFKVVERTLEEV